MELHEYIPKSITEEEKIAGVRKQNGRTVVGPNQLALADRVKKGDIALENIDEAFGSSAE